MEGEREVSHRNPWERTHYIEKIANGKATSWSASSVFGEIIKNLGN